MTSKVLPFPIVWDVERLMCECGGEFEHTLNTKNVDLPHLHVCNNCTMVEDTAVIYPHPVWREVV